MKLWSIAKQFLAALLLITALLLAFFWIASYRAERSFERTQIEMEKI